MRKIAAVALLLAGCGGGGEDAVVSASPPAAQPSPIAEAPPKAPGSSTPAPVPPPVQAPSPPPIAAPVPAPTVPAPVPSPVSPPKPPVAQEPTISGAAIANALQMRSLPEETALALGVGNGTTTVHAQKLDFAPRTPITAPGVYSVISKGWNNTDTRPRYDIPALDLAVDYIPRTDRIYDIGASLGSNLLANGAWLHRSEPYAIDPDATVSLNQTLAQWNASPWFVQLQVQTDATSNTVFRLCFHVKLPQIIRLSCGKFDRVTGQLRGVFVADDSQGLGSLTWATN